MAHLRLDLLPLPIEDHPVKHIVILVALSVKQILEEPAQVVVIRLFVKLQISTVLHVADELLWSDKLFVRVRARRRILRNGVVGLLQTRHVEIHFHLQ